MNRTIAANLAFLCIALPLAISGCDDAEVRKTFAQVHTDIQAERSRLDSGWTSLEQERQNIASQRLTQSMIVPAVKVAGGLGLIVVLLGYCWQALIATRDVDRSNSELCHLLVEEVTTGKFAFDGELLSLNALPSNDKLPDQATI